MRQPVRFLARVFRHGIGSIAVIGCLAACGGGAEDSTATGSTGTGPVASIRITPEARQIAVRETAVFTAEALDANGRVLGGKSFTFASSSPSVATIANPGASTASAATATALADGVTRITATAEGRTGTATLTVSGFANIQISGRVIDGQTRQGIAGARVEIGESGVFATTAADGGFSMAARNEVGSLALVELDVSRADYVTTRYRDFVEAPASTIEPIVLVRESGTRSTISGRLLNARNPDTPIPNAMVRLDRGQTFTAVGSAGSTTTDALGRYGFADLPAGTYTLSSQPFGFAACSRTTLSVGPPAAADQDLVCSPEGGNQIRIVLTWGTAPDDLDSHLTGPGTDSAGNADSSRFHVYYASRGSSDEAIATAPFAKLDVDDTREEGPETITITRLGAGVYRYSVHDFTNRGNPGLGELGASGAKVELYLPGVPEPRKFFVPNQPGNLWTVFELSGDLRNPIVTPLNTMGAGPDESSAIP